MDIIAIVEKYIEEIFAAAEEFQEKEAGLGKLEERLEKASHESVREVLGEILNDTDTYTCHGGKKLRPVYMKKQKSKSGYQSEVTVYECEDCAGCPYKDRCTKAPGNKKLYVSKNFLDKRMRSYENILSETGIRYRMNRSIQVEGAFGVLKNDYGFQRFLLRGKTRVKLEILLLCMGYNINKLHAKIQGERTQSHLFPVKAA